MRTVRTEAMVDDGTWLTTGEAAALLPVDEETLRRWFDLGPGKHFAKNEILRLPSGHRRIRRSAVDRILRGDPPPADAQP